MTNVQKATLFYGAAFTLIAVVGFFVSEGSMIAIPELAPHVFGLFPVNLVHNLAHLLFGIWGLIASRSHDGSVTYARVTGIAYLGLVVLAFFAPALFGLMPIGGNDIWLHLLIALPLLYFGFTARETRRTDIVV